MDDLAFLDATTQAALVRHGDVSPRELVDAAIARIERLDPRLNAVIHPSFEKARAAAAGRLPDGPFRGVPILLKDLFAAVAGDPYHLGCRVLRDLRWTAPHDSYLAAKFRAAGFVVVGRTNTPELGILPTTEPDAYGPTRNPWDPDRSTGGSSGGSAAAVAAGFVAAAHANDGGGSIRIPASSCGLVGLKPSRGRVTLGPDLGEWMGGLCVDGVVTRSVRDTAGILDEIAGAMPGDPYVAPPVGSLRAAATIAPPPLRIGLLTRPPGESTALHPQCAAAAEKAGRLLADLGHRVEPGHPAALDDPEASGHFTLMFTTAVARQLDAIAAIAGRPIGTADVDPLTWAMAELGRACSAPEYLANLEWIGAHTRRIAAWWAGGFDLLLTPTLPAPPPLLGSFDPRPDPIAAGQRAAAHATFTSPFNVTGQPAMSLPLHWTPEGLPIGVQLVAAGGREDLLVQVAAQLEAAAPWAARRPPLAT